MAIGFEAVAAVGVLVGFVVYWSHSVFYNFFIKKENEVKKLSEKHVDKLVKSYKSIKKEEGQDIFGFRLLDLIEFRHMINDGKRLFEKSILYSSLILIIFTFIYVMYQNTEYNNAILLIIIGLAIYLITRFHDMNNKKGYIERYLDGESPENIMSEIIGNKGN
ncbi:MAG: hypothetical protein HYW27_02100 [Candidatus Aenigmarchaeota archaeon]|nr:hypothetical protein [Candidatus Aenigmarchaeota archaeon]